MHICKFTRSHTTIAAAASAVYKPFNHIPGPSSYPLVGSFPNYLPGIGKYDVHDILKTGLMKYKEFGPIVKETIFNRPILFLYNPEDIETLFRNVGVNRRSHLTLAYIRGKTDIHVNGGLLYENGAAWSNLRSGSQQSLASKAAEKFLPKLDKFSLRLVDKIRKKDHVTHNVIDKDFLLALLAHSCDGVGYMLFGFEWDSVNDILNEDALTTRVIHSSSYINRMIQPMDNGLKLWKLYPTQLYKKMKQCIDDVDLIPHREITLRLKDQSLAEGGGILNSWIREGRLDRKTMTTLLSDFVLAGIDTTAYTVSFVLYLLSTNVAVQNTLYKELYELDPDITRPVQLSSELLARATYLKRVVKESMRLFPVSVGTSRTLDEPCVIGGYKIPPNVMVVTMNQITCRLDDYVERANEFIPERYEPSSGFKKLRPFTSLPFGHGPRACIGRRMAELSMYIFLFRLLRHFEIHWVGIKELGCISHSVTEPDGPLHFRFTPRSA